MKPLRHILLLKTDHQPADEDLTAGVRLAHRTGAALTFADLLRAQTASARRIDLLVAGHSRRTGLPA